MKSVGLLGLLEMQERSVGSFCLCDVDSLDLHINLCVFQTCSDVDA